MNKIIYIILVGCTLASSEMTSYGMREVAVHISTIGEGYVTRITRIDCTEIINGQATDQHYKKRISMCTPSSSDTFTTFEDAVPDLIDFIEEDPLVVFDRSTYKLINEELKHINKPKIYNKLRSIEDFGKLLGFNIDTLKDWSEKYKIEYSQYAVNDKLSELVAEIYQKQQEDFKDRINQIKDRIDWQDYILKILGDLKAEVSALNHKWRILTNEVGDLSKTIDRLDQQMDEENTKIETLGSEQCKMKGDISDMQQKCSSTRKKAKKLKTIEEEEQKKDESNRVKKPKRNRKRKTAQKLAKPQEPVIEDSVTEEIIQDQNA